MLYPDPLPPSQQSSSPLYPSPSPDPNNNPNQPISATGEVKSIPSPDQQQYFWSPLLPPQTPKRSKAQGAKILALLCLLVVVLGTGVVVGWTVAKSTPGANSSLEAAREAAIAKVGPSVVKLQDAAAPQGEYGSGVIIDKDGDIVTNNHVSSKMRSPEVVFSDGHTQQARLIGANPVNDLAVLRIQPFANMSFAGLGDASQLVVGQDVLAIGSPLRLAGTVTEGIVSSLGLDIVDTKTAVHLTGLIQFSADINPGNSGGALITLQGQVVGITTMTPLVDETDRPANGIAFAIPSSQVQQVVAQILRNQ